MVWTILGTAVVGLAAAQLLLWLALYIAGDVKDMFRRPQKLMSKPKFDVIIKINETEAPYLEACLASVYAGLQKPAQVLLSAQGGAHKKAVYLRRKHAFKNLHIFKDAPVEDLIKHAKQPTVVLVNGAVILHTSALGKGVSYFRNRKVKIVVARVIAHPDNSVLQSLIALRQIIHCHANRIVPQRNAIKSQKIVIFRRRLFDSLAQANAPLAADVYAYQAVRSIVTELFLQQNSIFWTISTTIWPAAIGVVLYAYGVERGVFMLYFAGAFAWLLTAVALFGYKGLRLTDRISLFLLAPFACLAWAASTIVCIPTTFKRNRRPVPE